MTYRRVLKLGTILSESGEHLWHVTCAVRYREDNGGTLRMFFRVNGGITSPFHFRDRMTCTAPVNFDILDKIIHHYLVYGTDLFRCATPDQQTAYIIRVSSHHDLYEASRYVRDSDFCVDNGHRFGATLDPVPSIPQEVLQFLFNLPGEGHDWGDICLPEAPDEITFLSLLHAEK